MNNRYINSEVKNLYLSIVYLIWVVLKENWIKVLSIIIFCFAIWLPLSILWTRDDGGATGYHVMAYNVLLPIIISALIMVPIIHQQIYSSSIKMRMEAAKISPRAFSLTLILMFTIFLTLLFYLFLSIFAIFLSDITVMVDENYDGVNETLRYQFMATYGIMEILFLPLIMIAGFVSVGVIISKLKINEIFKGIVIIVILFLTLFVSYIALDNLYRVAEFFPESSDELANSSYVKSCINKNLLILLNPFGTMSYTLQTTINSQLITQLASRGSDTDNLLKQYTVFSLNTLQLTRQIVGVAYAASFFGLSIYLS